MGSAFYQDVNITVNDAVLHHIVGVAVTDTVVAVASQCYFTDATTIHVRVIRFDSSNSSYKLTIKYI